MEETALPNWFAKQIPSPTPGAAGHGLGGLQFCSGGRRSQPLGPANPSKNQFFFSRSSPCSSLSYDLSPAKSSESHLPSCSLMPYPLSTSSTCQAAGEGSLSTTFFNFLILLLFYVLFFWPRGMWDPSFQTRDQNPHPLALEGCWTTEEGRLPLLESKYHLSPYSH